MPLGRLVALALTLFAWCAPWATTPLAAQTQTPTQSPATSQPIVYRVPVTGTIELGLAPFIKRSIRDAEQAGARAIILDVNTLGGRVDAALQIVDAVGGASIPVYAFVNPRAISAGALISIAADSVFMVPDALMGASTVVGAEGEKVSEKSQSVMRAQFRALAERRGLDPRIGEAMVDEDIAIPGLTDKGKLLTLTAHEAARVGYAIEARDFPAVLTAIGAPSAHVVTATTNWAEALVRFLTSPIVTTILLPLGILGILTEIKTPTFGGAGAVGIVAIALFFGAHMLVGLAGWEDVLLFTAGVVLIILEIFVFPGFGVAGVLGALCLGTGLFLAMLGNVSTSSGDDVMRALGVLGTSLLIVVVAFALLLRYLPKRANTFGIFLTTATTRTDGFIAGTSRTDLTHAEGVALTDLRPTGTAMIGTERLDVVSDSGFIAKGTRVRLVRAEPYRNVVLAVDEPMGTRPDAPPAEQA